MSTILFPHAAVRCLAFAALFTGVAGLAACRGTGTLSRTPHAVNLETRQLDPDFYAEGCCFADFNRDGHPDLAAGPWWFAGPDFNERHEIRTPRKFDPVPYSDNFLTFAGDFNGDGRPDILCVGYPGAPAFWYENPAEKGLWTKHPAFAGVDNESPFMRDMDGDGRPDLVCCSGGKIGWAAFDPKQPDAPWAFRPITPKGTYHRYTHGLGAGDVNGDGRLDILESNGWWEQPADAAKDRLWIFHPAAFGPACAQMEVCDVDGDGLPDVVCACHCHEYGMAWHRQARGADGVTRFERHDILSASPDLQSTALRISQMHALALADMDGDGHLDIVTGKRRWAHGPQGDPEPNAPPVLYWFGWTAPAGPGQPPTFTPHLIHADSGVGTQVSVADANGDGAPDVAVANKKGIHIHLSRQGGERSPK